MTNILMQRFNDITLDKYSYLKLNCVNVDVRAKSIEIIFIYPENQKEDVENNQDYIIKSVKKALNSDANINVILKMSHFDDDLFKVQLLKFFDKYPSVSSSLFVDNVFINKLEKCISISVKLEQSAFDYCQSRNIFYELDQFLEMNYTEKINIEFIPYKDDKIIDSIDELVENAPVTVMERDDGRFIIPENVEEFIGNIIYEKATYICDCACSMESATLCGTITNFKVLQSHPKEGQTEGKTFYKWILEDFTGKINCIYFPSKRTVDQATLLKDEMQIVARGSVELNTFKNITNLCFKVRTISLCTLPQDFKENRIIRQVANEYKYVSPKPYIKATQSNLFEEKSTPVPEFLKGKSFCIFDLETTGLDTFNDKIIEIAAVKVTDGKIKETFSTFVDPLMELSEKTTQLTSITNDDVHGQYTIDQVLPDFYKFSYGCPLVGHNIIDFDMKFIERDGKKLNIYFDNKQIDTLLLSKKYLKLHNYKQSTVLKYYGLVNEQAHRAIYDAIANAEAFIKLAEFL